LLPMRKKRKLDHLKIVQQLDDGPGKTGFEDIHFVHNCLPEIDPDVIDISSFFCGVKIPLPLMINAITGGITEAVEINRTLARVSLKLGIPMAVGSQTAGIDDKSVQDSFKVVRQENPEGFLVANIGISAPLTYALQAIEMIRADALQIHLNTPQEVMMGEKEREINCRQNLQKIAEIVKSSPVPVIIKEVGFGMAHEEARQLVQVGVAALDIGGKGGTNFIQVEGRRREGFSVGPFLDWGIPTAVSLIEIAENVSPKVSIVATGGLRNGLDVAKALCFGADLVGVAGPLVRCFYEGGERQVLGFLAHLQTQLKQVMMMLGTCNLEALRRRPAVIMGESRQWLEARGIDVKRFARSDRGVSEDGSKPLKKPVL
jgi:isopentenyl-diphosphate delta-isomerase